VIEVLSSLLNPKFGSGASSSTAPILRFHTFAAHDAEEAERQVNKFGKAFHEYAQCPHLHLSSTNMFHFFFSCCTLLSTLLQVVCSCPTSICTQQRACKPHGSGHPLGFQRTQRRVQYHSRTAVVLLQMHIYISS
jgi:hypothetical protein